MACLPSYGDNAFDKPPFISMVLAAFQLSVNMLTLNEFQNMEQGGSLTILPFKLKLLDNLAFC